MKSKNSKVLKSFVRYCEKHPTERFWQALTNWTKASFILFSEFPPHDIYEHDTFYFEGKDK